MYVQMLQKREKTFSYQNFTVLNKVKLHEVDEK